MRGGAEAAAILDEPAAAAVSWCAARRPVRALAFSSGFASAADAAGLRLWAQPWVAEGAPTVAKWPCVARVPAPATCLAAQAASLFCGREDGSVAIWDLAAATGRKAPGGGASISTWRYQLGVATLEDT